LLDPGGSLTPWSNPNNALVVDGTGAMTSLTNATGDSARLKVAQFGFALPPTAQVRGVTVTITRRANGGIEDKSVRLMTAALQGIDKSSGASWPAAFTGKDYGGASDLWGLALTPALVDSADFGVAIAASLDGADGTIAEIDGITMTISYCN